MGREDIPLSPRGEGDVAELANGLAGISFHAIYTSPRARAHQTAAAIADRQNGVTPVKESRIDETLITRWVGLTREELAEDPEFVAFRHNPLHHTDGIEPAEEVDKRVAAFLSEIEMRHGDNGVIAMVSHADPLRIALARFLGMPLTHFKRLMVKTASVCVVTCRNGEYQLTGVNVERQNLAELSVRPTLEPNAL